MYFVILCGCHAAVLPFMLVGVSKFSCKPKHPMEGKSVMSVATITDFLLQQLWMDQKSSRLGAEDFLYINIGLAYGLGDSERD